MITQKTFAPPKEKLQLTAYVFKYPRQFWLQAAGGVIYNTLIVFGAIFLGKTIDAANLVYNGDAPRSLFTINLFFFVSFTVVFQLARYFKRYYMRVITNLMNCDIRAGLLSALFEMPMNELSQERVGDMMSRMIGDVEQVSASVQTTITEVWDTVLLMFSHFIACMVYSPKITLLAAIPVPIVIFFAQIIRTPLYRLSQQARKAASNINVHLQHNVSGISLLRLFGLESIDKQKFGRLLDEQLKWNIAHSALQGSVSPLYILLATSGIILVVGFGGEYVVSGKWTIGMFTAYLSMFSAMAVRTSIAGRVMNTWHGAKASWDRICEKLQNGREAEAAFETTIATGNHAHALEVKDLSFRYPFTDENCLFDISFTAGNGEIIGVTGPVGSGKSALAAALSGLYPYDGGVYVSGIPLRGLGEARSRKISYMDSGQFVFSDDVTFNVALGRMDGDAMAALSLASMTEDMNAFEEGMDTRLMERGVRISGGQRQRISLARAWYGNSEILLLDDPFSAIDVLMEQRIMESIRAQIGNRTVLLFSHRLSAFELTDKVLVLEKGRVSQVGTHDDLVNQEGLYKVIYQAQKFMERGEAV
ncbi:MAG: ABC transporter ATP-binding protein/permease [Peptococcaceae bacterium]|nr:ABC transporter ATP-binding protein/permease [Peptococcaceae bacterium]